MTTKKCAIKKTKHQIKSLEIFASSQHNFHQKIDCAKPQLYLGEVKVLRKKLMTIYKRVKYGYQDFFGSIQWFLYNFEHNGSGTICSKL